MSVCTERERERERASRPDPDLPLAIDVCEWQHMHAALSAKPVKDIWWSCACDYGTNTSLPHMQPLLIYFCDYDPYAIYGLPHLFFVRFPCDYHTLIQT